jgi:dihydrofolate reductase
MRRIIAALQVSLDGFIEGPNGELDWVDSWEDPFDLLSEIDTCILGAGMYPGYEQYWRAIFANPTAPVPFFDKIPTKGEVEYAKFADRTPHIVLSRTMHDPVWHNTRVVRDVDAIRELKALPGKDMHAVGGAALVGSLMNAGLVDELRIVVQPIVLGSGKALFKDVKERHALRLVATESPARGLARLTYAV